MRRRAVVTSLLLVAALAAGGCNRPGDSADDGDAGNDGGAVPLRLVSNLRAFDACDDLLEYLRREGSAMVGPYGFDVGYGVVEDRVFSGTPLAASGRDASATAAAESAPAPTVAGPAGGSAGFSGTNVQEAGVDEPDIVKTDGRRVVTLTRGTLNVIDVAGAAPRLFGTLAISRDYDGGELFLVGDRVLVMRPEQTFFESPAAPDAPASGASAISPEMPSRPQPPRTRVTVVDIADPAKPKVQSELTVDGALVSSRLVGGIARLVLRSGPPPLEFSTAGAERDLDAATQNNRKLVEQTDLDDWLGSYSYSEPGNPQAVASGRLTDCQQVRRPQQSSGLGMVTVVSVDPADPRPGPGATVVGAGEIVYASATSLFVTSTTRVPPDPQPAQPEPIPMPVPQAEPGVPAAPTPSPVVPSQRLARPTETDIHKFDISDKVTTRYAGSGRVRGQLLNQFSMSEHEGHLRAATTIDGTAESQVAVLRERDGALEVVGEVGGLGKDERIYAVRFLGDRGYVVTFRQTDPLYVIDLADPTKPAVRGELKIPGYSAYLHPIGEHRLIGVGQDATDQGRTLGTQISLFDVSDAANPKRLANAVVPGAHSEAEQDHHAFLYWEKAQLALLPVQSYGDVGLSRGGRPTATPFVGAIGFRVGDGEVAESGRLAHRGGQPVRRSLVIGDRLMTLSDVGLLTSDISTLTEQSWLGL